MTIIPIVIGTFGTVTKGLLKGLEDLEQQHYWKRTEYWEESWRLAVTQSPVKDHQLTLMRKTLMRNNNNNNNKWIRNVPFFGLFFLRLSLESSLNSRQSRFMCSFFPRLKHLGPLLLMWCFDIIAIDSVPLVSFSLIFVSLYSIYSVTNVHLGTSWLVSSAVTYMSPEFGRLARCKTLSSSSIESPMTDNYSNSFVINFISFWTESPSFSLREYSLLLNAN